MKKQELEKLKANLLKKQEVIEETLNSLHREKTRVDNPLSKSNEDDNTQIFSADLLIDILDELEYKEYNLVQKALSKISDGSYGICEECDAKITLKRLLAVPFAKMCISCAREEEEFNTRIIKN